MEEGKMSTKMMDGFSASQVSISDNLTEWRDWSGLPGHLLFDITDKFTDIADYIQFGRVCISWQSIFLQNMNNLGSPLFLIDPPDHEDNYKQRALYSLSTKSVCNFRIQLPHSKICRGSSFGWLITMEVKGEDNYHIQLRNPFLNHNINLPTLDNIVQLHPDEHSAVVSSEYLQKAALSSDPSLSDDFIVMGIMSRYLGLAFLKPGNKCWTSIENCWSLDSTKHKRFADVIFFHKARQFYARLLGGEVLGIEFRGDEEEPKLTQVAPPLGSLSNDHDTDENDTTYLLEDLSSGELLQVCRREEQTEEDETGKRQMLIRFVVFKFDPAEQNWTEVHNLGGKVAFIGSAFSILRSAPDCPGCLPNCIYYTTSPDWAAFDERKFYEPLNNGIYNLEDGTWQPHYSPSATDNLFIWLEPTLSKQRPLRN